MSNNETAREVATRLLHDLRRDIAAECALYLDALAAQLVEQSKDAEGAVAESRARRADAYHLAADDLRRQFGVQTYGDAA